MNNLIEISPSFICARLKRRNEEKDDAWLYFIFRPRAEGSWNAWEWGPRN